MQALSTVRIESARASICGHEVRVIDRVTGQDISQDITRIEIVIAPTEGIVARLTFRDEEGMPATAIVHNPEVALTAIVEVEHA